MKFIAVSIALLFALGCASQSTSSGSNSSSASKSRDERYECYTYVGSKHVLTLPVPAASAPAPFVFITFHGDRLPAMYQRNGLTQLWALEDSLYIQVDPDFVGRYMDFRGAEEGETRKAEAVFKCKKRR